MKQIIPRIVCTFVTVIFCSISFAYDFMEEGIYYNKLSENTVEVTSGSINYRGDIVIPSTVSYNGSIYTIVSIGDYAFQYRSKLTSVKIPDGVTSIGKYAFYGCEIMESIYIPEGVTSIGDYAFGKCIGLKSINIPNAVTSIGNGIFYHCESLASITIPDCVTIIKSGAFAYCVKLATIDIPRGVQSIETGAFLGSGMISIKLPDNLTSISPTVFMYCSKLETVTIPGNVTSIGKMAFSGCSSLKNIVSLSTNPPKCDKDVFSGVSTSECELYIPDNAIGYETTEPWKNFSIVYGEYPNAAIKNVLDDVGIFVSTPGNQITISGTVNGETIDVYNFGGSKVKSVKTCGESTSIKDLQSGNVYIVKIRGTKVKVKL